MLLQILAILLVGVPAYSFDFSAVKDVAGKASDAVKAKAGDMGSAPTGGHTSSRPDVVAACKTVQDQWTASCHCSVDIMIDVSTVHGAAARSNFENQGLHLCENMTDKNERDINGNLLGGVTKMCEAHAADLCKIKQIRLTAMPANTQLKCLYQQGVLTSQTDGNAFMDMSACYKKVTSW